MAKGWSKSLEVSGYRISYGFIYEGGKKWGDRYFVTVNDKAVDVGVADGLVALIEALSAVGTTPTKELNKELKDE